MTTTPEGLARKFQAMGESFGGEALKRSLRKGGTAAKNACLEVAESATGSNRTILMGGRRRVVMGAGYDLGTTSITINLRPPGLWKLMESGAKPHREPKRRSDGFMAFEGFGHSGEGAAVVNHPGRGGRGAIRRAFAKGAEAGVKATEEGMLEEMRRAWL